MAPRFDVEATSREGKTAKRTLVIGAWVIGVWLGFLFFLRFYFCGLQRCFGMGSAQSKNLEQENGALIDAAVTPAGLRCLAASAADTVRCNLKECPKAKPSDYDESHELSAIEQKHLLVFLVFMVLICNLPKTQGERQSPKHYQIEVYNETHSTLQNCTVCPKGHGLSVECGTSVKVGVKNECKRCILGKTYSDSEDYQMCKACRFCTENQEVTGNCTVEKDNTVCGKCKAEHYKSITGDCDECSWCCNGTEDHDRMPDCKTMPLNKQCMKQSHDCAPTTSSTTIGSDPPMGHTTESKSSSKSTTSKPTTSSTTIGSDPPMGLTTEKSSSKSEVPHVVLGVSGSLLLVIILSIATWKGRHQIQQKVSQLQRAFCHYTAAGSSSRNTCVCSPNACDESESVECGLMISDGNDGESQMPLSSGNVEQDTIEDASEQRSGRDSTRAGRGGRIATGDNQPPEIDRINTPFVEHQIEDETLSISDSPGYKGLISAEPDEESPRSKRRDLLAERVSNLPLRFHRKICALLNNTTDLLCDYRDLGEMLGLEVWELTDLKRSRNPADAVLQKYNSSTDGTVRAFVGYLEELERQDVIDVIHEWMDGKCPFQNNHG